MSEKARYAAVLCGAVIAFFCFMPAVRAETPLHRPIEVTFDGVSVESALATLGERAGVRFEYDAALMRGLHSVTYQAEGQEAGRIAMRILYPRGLDLGEIRGNRVRIVKRGPFDEQRPRREENYEFARKPEITRDGDRVTIAFETAGWCDVTIAIEDEQGDIIRHLASGVLGPNAPEPFQWNTKVQRVVWDGKDDAGVYIDDKDAVTVRVSLGLKPRFERTLFWSPERRAGNVQALAAGPDGVYVLDTGRGVDHIRSFGRDGRYQRTVYPFPADKIEEIPDLMWQTLPDGPTIPVKPNTYQTTLLKGGSGFTYDYSREDGHYRATSNTHDGKYGWSGRTLAVAGSHLALSGVGFNRLAADGSSGGLPLYGSKVANRRDRIYQVGRQHGVTFTDTFVPQRAALSPDARWLYLTRRVEVMVGHYHTSAHWDGHDVQRVNFADGGEPETFLGSEEAGDEPGQFKKPSDVATDPEGRIYVADHGNHRVQVFSPDGEWQKSIDVKYPAQVSVHQRTGEIYVFCWPMPRHGRRINYTTGGGWTPEELPPYGDVPATRTRLHKFAPIEQDAKPLNAWPLPMRPTRARRGYSRNVGDIDSWADPTTIWITPGPSCDPQNVLVLRENGDELERVRDFHTEAERTTLRTRHAPWQRQRLYLNPADGMLYVGEGTSREGKSFQQVIRIDPRTGRLRKIDLPHNSEDMAFDRDGHVYLRTRDMITRYQPDTWREVPFDYGEHREREGYPDGGGDRTTEVVSGATFPGNRGWHQGGMHLNARGDIVIGVLYEVDPRSRLEDGEVHQGERFEPRMYPGRRYDPGGRFGGMLIHILDRHGQMVHADAVPGLIHAQHGVALSADRQIFLLAHRARAYDGESGWNPLSGTLIRLTPGQNRFLSAFGAPVPMDSPPDRLPDLFAGRNRGRTWVEGAHWFYGDAGWSSYNSSGTSLCSCHNSRFALDYFDRSFTPEVARYNVGVVDSRGNLILRVGQYGNADDGQPLVRDGGPPNPRSIGGDEVALFHPAYLATHSDRRLFIADAGNARIVSVKLSYHTDEIMKLRDVPEQDN